MWFCGVDADKLNVTSAKDYDDENGTYLKVNKDHIAYRYEIIETLGKGSFGQVLRCYDHKKKEYVAIKIIRSKKRYISHTLLIVFRKLILPDIRV